METFQVCRNLARIGATNHNLTICSLPLGYFEIVISGTYLAPLGPPTLGRPTLGPPSSSSAFFACKV